MTPDKSALIELRDLRVWFPIQRGVLNRTVGQVHAVDGVSFAIQPGETLGLVGESGCGKTTLGRAVIGLENPTSGTLRLTGVEIGANRTRAQRRQLQMIFQDPFASLNPRLTVIDLLTEAMLVHGLIRRAQTREAAQTLLMEVGLDNDALQLAAKHGHAEVV
ncbi:MAG: ATP-binding cassette domain-containing protein, partial [Kiritimatiellia bacterium]